MLDTTKPGTGSNQVAEGLETGWSDGPLVSPRARRVVFACSVLLGLLSVASGLALTRFDRRTDFRIFYSSALAWRDGGTVYPDSRPNLNLPAVVVAYVPLTYLSEQNAMTLFTLIGIGCAVAASRCIAGVVPQVPWIVLASLVFSLQGGWTNLWLGQEGLILMLPATLAWLADRERRGVAAGAWGGLMIYAKPFLLGLLAYWIWRRRWRAVASASATLAVLFLIGLAATGPSGYSLWFRSLGNGPAPYSPLNASLLGLWSRMFFGSEFAPPLVREPRNVLLTAWALSLIALLIAIYRQLRADWRDDVAWALVIIGSLLASPIGWVYYLPFATGPLVASLSGAASWAVFWVSANILLFVRTNALANLAMGPVAIITLGSAYVWSLVLLLVAVRLGRRGPEPAS